MQASDGLVKDKKAFMTPANEANDAPAQALETALKKRRDKLATDKDHIAADPNQAI